MQFAVRCPCPSGREVWGLFLLFWNHLRPSSIPVSAVTSKVDCGGRLMVKQMRIKHLSDTSASTFCSGTSCFMNLLTLVSRRRTWLRCESTVPKAVVSAQQRQLSAGHSPVRLQMLQDRSSTGSRGAGGVQGDACAGRADAGKV